MAIHNICKVGSDYFKLYKIDTIENLDYYLDQFNFNDYYCIKAINDKRLVSYDQLLKFKSNGYIFFRKDVYSLEFLKKLDIV